jgi:hypothetical protein
MNTNAFYYDGDHDGKSDRLEYEDSHLLSTTFIRMSSVFALVLIIFSNFISDLFNGTIKHMLSKYHFKHFVGILVMYFFVMLVDVSYTEYSYAIQFAYLIGLYAIFLLFTRCEGRFAMICLGLLLILYSIHSWFNNMYLRNKEILKENFTNLRKIEKILGVCFCVFLFIGFTIYVGFIKNKWGNKMSFYKLYMDEMQKYRDVPCHKLFDCFVLGLKTFVGL